MPRDARIHHEIQSNPAISIRGLFCIDGRSSAIRLRASARAISSGPGVKMEFRHKIGATYYFFLSYRGRDKQPATGS